MGLLSFSTKSRWNYHKNSRLLFFSVRKICRDRSTNTSRWLEKNGPDSWGPWRQGRRSSFRRYFWNRCQAHEYWIHRRDHENACQWGHVGTNFQRFGETNWQWTADYARGLSGYHGTADQPTVAYLSRGNDPDRNQVRTAPRGIV